jgi:hypothetical protein
MAGYAVVSGVVMLDGGESVKVGINKKEDTCKKGQSTE